jgi:RNA polymerase sigma factor (TIGR02999 family)
MPEGFKHDLTQLLIAWGDGDKDALNRLTPFVYDELHRLARYYMSGERAGHLLQTSALVNEAYLKLVDSSRVKWQNRAHFITVSAQLMRRILVDFARSQNYQKRGGGMLQVSLAEVMAVSSEKDSDLGALDEALETLARMDERKGKVVELRFFGGLSVDETAEALKISVDTVMRDWKFAKVWLLRELSKS